MIDAQQTTVYGLLNTKAKAWWYHHDLRKAGKHDEARVKERASIKNNVRALRDCFWFSTGRGGFTLHGRYIPFKDGNGGSQGSLTGLGMGEEFSQALAIARPGVPRVNSRVIPDDLAWNLVRMPMAQDRASEWNKPNDKGEYGGFSYCPLGILLACYEALGAEVHWGDINAEEWRVKAKPTINRVREA